MYRIIFSILLVPFLLIACNDEFSINDHWEDNTVVMGLLNSSDTAQYIKINKSFLGEGDVYEMAKVADSIQYQSILKVQLIEYKIVDANSSPYQSLNWTRTSRDTIQLFRTNEIEKSALNNSGEEGTFGTELNYLYKTKEKLVDGYKYKLIISIPYKPDLVWSEAFMIEKFVPLKPTIYETVKIDMSNEVSPYVTNWKSAVYGKIYQVFIRFNYLEINDEDSTYKSIFLENPLQIVEDIRTPKATETGSNMEQKVGGSKFFESIQKQITESSTNIRYFKNIDFVYLVGGQYFYTYMNVSNTEVSYGQSAPIYSNINNGYGLFDARFIFETKGKVINNRSLDSLAFGRFTKNLNFKNSLIN